MGELQTAYRQAVAHARLAPQGSRFGWELDGGLDIVRWQIAREAVGLLEAERLGRVNRRRRREAAGRV